jgi:hypothetical protein
MSRFRLRRPSGATLIAVVALFVALGGTGYAAFSLPKNSVGSKQLKKNAVTTRKIKNRAVTAGKINTSGLTVPNASHANSADNAINSTNATNATTAATTNGQGTLASGKTEIGIIGGKFQNGPTAASPMSIAVTFPLLAPVALSGSNIEVAPTANCTGSTANPTAAAGFVCIYPDVVSEAAGISGDTGVNGDTKLGFELDWETTAANQQSSVRAEWAYTAP